MRLGNQAEAVQTSSLPIQTIRERMVGAGWLVAGFYVATLGLLVAVALAGQILGHPFGFFSRDPAASMNAPFYVGFLSQVGVLVLWTSAVIAVLCGALLRHLEDRPRAAAFLVAGLFLAWLSLDDLFQLHEVVIPKALHIPQVLVIIVYCLAGLTYAWRYRWFLRTTPWVFLLVGAIFFGWMAITDIVGDHTGTHLHMMEDGAKLFGIVSLFTFVILSSTQELTTISGSPGRQRHGSVSALSGAYQES